MVGPGPTSMNGSGLRRCIPVSDLTSHNDVVIRDTLTRVRVHCLASHNLQLDCVEKGYS